MSQKQNNTKTSSSPQLEAGQKAPPIALPDSAGEKVTLSAFKGKKHVVLYFYPKDDTPGCTLEACNFRDEFIPIKRSQAVVIGISPDPVSKHAKFRQKYDLPFILLSDENKSACQRYGVWVEKNMYGRKYMGVARTTFLIRKDGKIAAVFRNVKPKGHAKEVLEALRDLD